MSPVLQAEGWRKINVSSFHWTKRCSFSC